jgi:Zn-dependent oligopeptidase
VKPYFPLDRNEAAFDCAQRLFGISFVQLDSTYHPDVVVYEGAATTA